MLYIFVCILKYMYMYEIYGLQDRVMFTVSAEELSEIMNESFKSVFTVEGAFIKPNILEAQEGLKEVVVQKQGAISTANMGSNHKLNKGREGAKRVEEGQHCAYIQRRKED